VNTTVIIVVFLQDGVDSRSSELGSHSALCATSSVVGKKVLCVLLERITVVTDVEDHEQMTSALTDPGVGFISVDRLACFVVIKNYLCLYKTILVNS